MDDPYNDYRAQRRYYRQMRRSYRNPMAGLAGGVFMLALFFAFLFSGAFGGAGFLVWLFIGLAFCSLFGSISSMNRYGIYGGLHGFVWMLGLALCFWVGFWPWILLPIAVSGILGSLMYPIMTGLAGAAFLASSQAQQQPGYQQQPYQQGYQGGPPQPQASYQEGGQPYQYTEEPKQQYEQPQVQYPNQPPQELPPMEQQQ